jgi:membrane associated rhomboid family serine protease
MKGWNENEVSMARRVSFRLPSVQSAAAALAVALVATSVLVAVFRGLAPYLLLVPELVVSRFYVWELVTYGLLETSPMGVIFGAIILWSLGGALEARWGQRRFLLFSAGIVAAAGAATVALSLVVPALVVEGYPGGTVLTGSLWVAYGLLVGRSQTNFWGLPLTGNLLALIGAGFVFLSAAFGGIRNVIPDVFALTFTWLVVRGYSPGRLWTRLRSWQLERELKRRSGHLRSVEGGRRSSGPNDRDQFLN